MEKISDVGEYEKLETSLTDIQYSKPNRNALIPSIINKTKTHIGNISFKYFYSLNIENWKLTKNGNFLNDLYNQMFCHKLFTMTKNGG